MRRVTLSIGAVAASTVLLLAFAAAFGHPAGTLLSVLIEGSIGSRFAIEGTLIKSVPLLLTGLSVAVAFRAGVWNIGAEGQFIAGALGALLAAPFGAIAAMGAAMVAGMAWASIATLLRFWRHAPEVLTTILLNFLALHLLGYAVNGPLQESGARYPQSDAIPAQAMLPHLGASEVHTGALIAVATAIALWFFLQRTTAGLRLRATGFNPSAARHAGVNVAAQIARAMAISGAVAGLAGGIELLGVTHRLFERFAAGYGYSGIAVALLADLHPLTAIASALFFGASTTGAGELQRSAGVSASIATFGQAIVILALLAFPAGLRLRRQATTVAAPGEGGEA